MGKAKIASHDGGGLYTVIYYRDNTKVDQLNATLQEQLTQVQAELLRVANDINVNYGYWDAERDKLSDAIDLYQVCVTEAENPVDCDNSDVLTYSASTRKELGILNLSYEEEQRLLFQQNKLTVEIARLNSAPSEEETMQIWCVDLCARLTSQPDTGDWKNIGEVIADDTIVGTIEIFNYSTKKYDIWIEPASYGRSATYNSATHGIAKPTLSSNAYGFVYNFEMRSPTITWKSKYKVATVTDCPLLGGMSVEFDDYKVDELGVSLLTSLDETKVGTEGDVDIDYMISNPYKIGSVFDIGDRVIIRFDGDKLTSPVCIGFYSHPKRYVPSIGFVMYNAGNRVMMRCDFDETTELWSCAQTARNHQSRYWNRRSDGAYVSFDHYVNIDDASNTMDTTRHHVYVGSTRYILPAEAQYNAGRIHCAGLTANNELVLVTRTDTAYEMELWKYDFSTWTKISTFNTLGIWPYNDPNLNEQGTTMYFNGADYYARLDIESGVLTKDATMQEEYSGYYKQSDGDFKLTKSTRIYWYSGHKHELPNVNTPYVKTYGWFKWNQNPPPKLGGVEMYEAWGTSGDVVDYYAEGSYHGSCANYTAPNPHDGSFLLEGHALSYTVRRTKNWFPLTRGNDYIWGSSHYHRWTEYAGQKTQEELVEYTGFGQPNYELNADPGDDYSYDGHLTDIVPVMSSLFRDWLPNGVYVDLSVDWNEMSASGTEGQLWIAMTGAGWGSNIGLNSGVYLFGFSSGYKEH